MSELPYHRRMTARGHTAEPGNERTSVLPAVRVFVVIPAYSEAAMIGRVVESVRQRYPDVVVVDDGSMDDTAARALDAGAVVLRHVLNRGQGAALQTGITYSLRRGAEVIVTFDSDGQHSPDDIESLIEAVVLGGADVALGSRFLGAADGITKSRRALLWGAVAFTRATSGLEVTDAHNGLRCLSRKAAESIDIRLDRMAHASELVDQIGRLGLTVKEVPVHIRYTEYSRSKGQRSTGALRIMLDYLFGKYMR